MKAGSRVLFACRLFFCTLLYFCQHFDIQGQSSSRILEYNTLITVVNNNLIEEESFLIQINDKQSDWLSDIEIVYEKGTRMDILEASVIGPRGEKVRELNKKEIVTKTYISNGSFYEDNLIKEFSLKWNEYPYRILYRYRTTTDRFDQIAYWHPLHNPGIPTSKASLKVELPYKYKVNIFSSGNLNHRIDSLEKSYILSWDTSNIGAIHKEIFAPAYQELVPVVRIVPKVFKYGLTGNLDSWSTYGNWTEETNKDLITLPISEQVEVDTLIKGIKDRNEIIRRLYHYMQDNTRYISVNIDIGGLVPFPASYVSANKYGDCKALTIYLKALLKLAGINSNYTVIYAGENPLRVNKEFPSNQFNHVILCVPGKEDTIWLENTNNCLPFNYLGTFTQNRYGLFVDGLKSSLVKTPSLKPEDVCKKTFYHFILNQTGEGKLYFEQQIRGTEFVDYLSLINEGSKEDQKSVINKSLPLTNPEIIKWDISQGDRDSPEIDLKAEVLVTDQFRKIGESLVINALSPGLFSLEKVGIRKYPVRINFPVNRIDSIVYELPFIEDYKISIPQEVKIETKYGYFKANFVKKGEQIIGVRKLQLYNNDCSVEEYPDFYAFIENIRESVKKSNLILNR